MKNNLLKMTKARQEIWNTLRDASQPLCYDDFTLSMDKATFYRNIALFEEHNLIAKFESDDKKWYFEILSTPHAHFICKQCRQVSCLNDITIHIPDYTIETIILKGNCPQCLKRINRL